MVIEMIQRAQFLGYDITFETAELVGGYFDFLSTS